MYTPRLRALGATTPVCFLCSLGWFAHAVVPTSLTYSVAFTEETVTSIPNYPERVAVTLKNVPLYLLLAIITPVIASFVSPTLLLYRGCVWQETISESGILPLYYKQYSTPTVVQR